MKVKLITIGRFHHFHLARQLHKFKLLDEIYSGFPKFKLREEFDIPKNKIKTYPYYQVPYLFFQRYLKNFSPKINHYLANLSHKMISNKVAKNMGEANILIASSGAGLEAFKKLNFKNKELTLIGPIEKKIKKKIEKYFSENIKYLSIIKNTQLNKYYSNTDVLVQPSIQEGLPY